MASHFQGSRQGILPPRIVVPARRGLNPPASWWLFANAPRIVSSFLAPLFELKETPFVDQPGLARSAGVARVLVKYEADRLDLGSFKSLGGAYAVIRLVHNRMVQRFRRPVDMEEMLTEPVRGLTAELVVTCASDGNHGLSVAAGARLLGVQCVVFLHEGVNEDRVEAIERLGARTIRTPGAYGQSVAEAAAQARAHGWLLVADTADPDDPDAEACRFVMQGYTVLVDEILTRLSEMESNISHVFVQAGVGGLAAAVMGHWHARGPSLGLPSFIIVEPDKAACLMESARQGEITEVPAAETTVMAMLECQKPSSEGWPTIAALADAYVTVSDEEAVAAAKMATASGMATTASGAAGLAGLLAARSHPDAAALGLGPESTVLLIVTEGRAGGEGPSREGA